MRRSRAVWAVALLAVSGVTLGVRDAGAQRPDRRPPLAAGQAQRRDGLERQFRERLADVVRRRLNLDESQMRRLGDVNSRFERERMGLLRQERQVRLALREQVLAGDSANQPKVAELLDQAMRIQRQRLDLVEREQRELATFMTPVQRAMYFGIQDDLRRRMEDMRQQRRAGALGAGARRPPP